MAAVMGNALTCPVCYEHLDIPKILACGHTFCKKCLDDIYLSESYCHMTCPICRNVTSVPGGDVSKLPTNITVKGLVEDFKSANRYSDLQKRAEMKIEAVIEHAEYVNQQKLKVTEAISACRGEINEAHGEAVAKLANRKATLLRVCDEQESALQKKLDKMAAKDDELVSSISNARELMNDGVKTSDKGHATGSIDTLCDKLEGLVETGDPHTSEATEIYRRGEMFHFRKHHINLDFGEIVIGTGKWKVHAASEFSEHDGVNSIVPTSDGKMAVGSRFGGVETFSADGYLEQTLLKEVCVRDVAFFSDGRCAIRNCNEQVSLYTPEWKKLDVTFETLKDDGGIGGLTVDSDDRLYVGYRNAKKIHVFTPAGGKAAIEILCGVYEPMQMSVMEPGKLLVIKTDRHTVMVFDHQGKERHKLVKDYYIHPAVSNNGTILIAVLNKTRDTVRIERYTSDLKYMKTLINDHVIEKTKRNWYCLREFSSGELALCTTDRLYIFQKIVSPTESHV